jgi:hypothetical protein
VPLFHGGVGFSVCLKAYSDTKLSTSKATGGSVRSTRAVNAGGRKVKSLEPQRSRRKVAESKAALRASVAAAVIAMLDRLLHHGHVLKCGPRSWRTKLDAAEP